MGYVAEKCWSVRNASDLSSGSTRKNDLSLEEESSSTSSEVLELIENDGETNIISFTLEKKKERNQSQSFGHAKRSQWRAKSKSSMS